MYVVWDQDNISQVLHGRLLIVRPGEAVMVPTGRLAWWHSVGIDHDDDPTQSRWGTATPSGLGGIRLRGSTKGRVGCQWLTAWPHSSTSTLSSAFLHRDDTRQPEESIRIATFYGISMVI